MRISSTAQILEQGRRADRRRGANGSPGAVDRSLPYIHEHFTQLYHTDAYDRLSRAERLRYNQLCGVRTLEHFMVFESGFTNRVIEKLARLRAVLERPPLAQCLLAMLEDERRHHAMFRELNRRCCPELYVDRDLCFARLRWWEQALLRVATARPQHLPCLVWLILVLEEHAVSLSRSIGKRQETESLGPIAPQVVEAHLAHLRDEARHVHLDAHVIELLLAGKTRARLHAEGALFRRLFNELTAPKRSAIAVIRRLVLEFPRLSARERDMVRAVRAQTRDAGMAHTLAQTSNMPISSALMRTHPQFRLGQNQSEAP